MEAAAHRRIEEIHVRAPRRCRTIAGTLLLLGSLLPAEGFAAGLRVGEEIPFDAGTAHPYQGSPGPEPAWSVRLDHPGATYLAVHFARFELAAGDRVIVRSPDGRQRHELGDRGRSGSGTFWAPHIRGDRAVVELFAAPGPRGAWGASINRYAAGFLDPGSTESLCGPDDKVNAVCAAGVEDAIYDHSRAVARLLINGTSFCTGWLVGCRGHLLTNEHCITSQAEAANTDYEFLAEEADCGDRSCPGCGEGVIWPGEATLVRDSATLDYALVHLAGDPQLPFGSFLLADRAARVGEPIYIPQHPGGRAKEIGRLSSAPQDAGGRCRIAATDEPPCTGGTGDVGYYCDTEPGSSGSPVVSARSHRVVALHHCAACANRGVPAQAVIADLGPLLPACALEDGPQLIYRSYVVDDADGGGNGIADPGETLRLEVTVANAGDRPATAIAGTLSARTPGVTVTVPEAAFGDAAPSEEVASRPPHFELRLDPDLPCGSAIDLRLDFAAEEGGWTMGLRLPTGLDVTPTQRLESRDVPRSIPDGRLRGTASRLEVPAGGIATLGDVQVSVEIRHPFIGDLQMALTSPAGTTVVLHDRSGAGRDDIATTYDGLTAPDGPGTMADFDGEDPAGTWVLAIRDVASMDTGGLERWGLTLRGDPAVACAGPGALTLRGPMPGVVGSDNVLLAGGATPGGTVRFLASARAGSTAVEGCRGLRVGLAEPVLLGAAVAGPGGHAVIGLPAPQELRGRTVRFQAVDTAACVASVQQLYTFP